MRQHSAPFHLPKAQLLLCWAGEEVDEEGHVAVLYKLFFGCFHAVQKLPARRLSEKYNITFQPPKVIRYTNIRYTNTALRG